MKKSLHKPKLCNKKETKKPKQRNKTEEELRMDWILMRRAIIAKHQNKTL